MPIEAELKARVRDVAAFTAALDARGEQESAIYRDRFFDSPDRTLDGTGHGLRIRSVDKPGSIKHVLMYKALAVEATSASAKPKAALSNAPHGKLLEHLDGLAVQVGRHSVLASALGRWRETRIGQRRCSFV